MKGFPGNMQGLMQQAQKMQKQLEKAQEEAAALKAEGTAGGVVKVVANGEHQIEDVNISEEVKVESSEDREMLQDMIKAAANAALRSINEQTKDKLGKITGGLSIPGLF